MAKDTSPLQSFSEGQNRGTTFFKSVDAEGTYGIAKKGGRFYPAKSYGGKTVELLTDEPAISRAAAETLARHYYREALIAANAGQREGDTTCTKCAGSGSIPAAQTTADYQMALGYKAKSGAEIIRILHEWEHPDGGRHWHEVSRTTAGGGMSDADVIEGISPDLLSAVEELLHFAQEAADEYPVSQWLRDAIQRTTAAYEPLRESRKAKVSA